MTIRPEEPVCGQVAVFLGAFAWVGSILIAICYLRWVFGFNGSGGFGAIVTFYEYFFGYLGIVGVSVTFGLIAAIQKRRVAPLLILFLANVCTMAVVYVFDQFINS